MKRADGTTLTVAWDEGPVIGHVYHVGPTYFTYDPAWLAGGHDLSPLVLPFNGQAHNVTVEGCQGLPGFLADALPDAWGTRVAEAVFARNGWGAVTPMKLLAWIGNRAPGALSFQPTNPSRPRPSPLERISAERLAREAARLLRGDPAEVAAIAAAGGSAGGAHPKALVVSHPDGTLSLARRVTEPGDHPAILKLGLPEHPSLRIEHAYLEMARAAGVDATRSQLVPGGSRVHLMIHRFDWADGRRLHLHSLSGLWHRPKTGLDYSDLFRAAVRLRLPHASVVEIARRLLFNLYAANHDDHGRNHAFLYDRSTAKWRLSPAFDLTHSPGTLSRGLTIAGEVSPRIDVLTAFLETVSLAPTAIHSLIRDVTTAVDHWPHFAALAGVPKAKVQEVSDAHRRIRDRVGRP